MAQNLGTQRSGNAPNHGARWPFEDNEMARRIRVFDWASTPLGATAGWPQNLRCAVDLILGCGFPGMLQWGASAILLYNDAYTGVIGVEHPAALGQPMFTAFPQAREACEPILQHVRGGETVVCEDPLYRYLHGSVPEETRFTTSYSPVRGEDGEVAGVLAIGMEMAAISLYFSRQALSESEERLRLFIENVHEYALVQTDLECKVASWNPGAQRLFGYRSDEIIGQDFSLLLTPEDRRSNLLGEESTLLARGERKEDARWFVRKDGSRIWTRWISEPIKDERGTIRGLARVLCDETERLRTETSVRQSEKLAIAGRLASSIAHEINNPLEAVTNLIFLARRNTSSSLTTRYLDEAERELRRVSLITNEALKFHRQASGPAKVDVAEILDAVLLFHESRLQSAQVTTERRYRPHPTITCFPNEIRQVLANLVGNAVDAMTHNTDVRRLVLRIQSASHPRTGGAGVRLTIADTGSGISQTSRKHIFEPFFTTKSETGMGLGLWVSAEIVKKHQGSLRFHSNPTGPSRGTVFSLFLNESFDA